MQLPDIEALDLGIIHARTRSWHRHLDGLHKALPRFTSRGFQGECKAEAYLF